MNPFTYSRATDASAIPGELAGQPKTKFLGGGTNLIDLMKQGVETPTRLVDVHRLPPRADRRAARRQRRAPRRALAQQATWPNTR